MSDTVIQVENLGKKYIIGHQKPDRSSRYVALRDVLAEGARSLGQRLRQPFAPVENPQREEFWALKDVSFEVKQGECVGIIGRNGAGKSTLLKILSRITEPTEGRIKIRGRVASLLEVGTGFHPELTGRENIYLNGAILGMTRVEIRRKFDEIVDFAEVEKFLDTPVKHYSSGMYVRLAFAVAAHLEPEILVVDEVLAVGDAAFQKKCLGKMGDVTEREGRTVLFVSHNMNAVSQLCQKAIFLEKGKLVNIGNAEKVIRIYGQDNEGQVTNFWKGDIGDENIRVYQAWVKTLDNNNYWHTATDIEIGIEIDILKRVEGLVLGFNLISAYDAELAYILYDDAEESKNLTVEKGRRIERFIIPNNTLAIGFYKVQFDVGIHNVKRIIKDEIMLKFSLDNISGIGKRFLISDTRGFTSIFRPNWTVIHEKIETDFFVKN